ncbi:unnamed protein product [Linum tenue]|uniref:Uncharacterized protein n=1 Tax=Linum tenue TaxID=586396 RepID=A0AAV0L329_9ROSI|nr:unnamed protein product [Linum tenue]
MVLFDFKSNNHFVTSNDSTTLRVWELRSSTIHPSHIRKTHWKEVGNIIDDNSGEEQYYDGLLFFDGHGKIEAHDALTKLAQHLAWSGLMVSPGGYCFQNMTELGENKDFGIQYYLRLNDLFNWPHHGVHLARISTWQRLELEYMVPRQKKISKLPMLGGVVSKEKYEELKRMVREKDEELWKQREEMEEEIQKVCDKKNGELQKLKEEMDEVCENQEEELQKLRKEKDEERLKLLKKKDGAQKMLESASNELQKLRKEKTEELRKLRGEMQEKIEKMRKEKEEEVENLEKREEEILQRLRDKDDGLEIPMVEKINTLEMLCKEKDEAFQKLLEKKDGGLQPLGKGKEVGVALEKLQKEKNEEMQSLRREMNEELESLRREKDAELKAKNNESEMLKRIQDEGTKMNKEHEEELTKLREEVESLRRPKDEEASQAMKEHEEMKKGVENEQKDKEKALQSPMNEHDVEFEKLRNEHEKMLKELEQRIKQSWMPLPTTRYVFSDPGHKMKRRAVPLNTWCTEGGFTYIYDQNLMGGSLPFPRSCHRIEVVDEENQDWPAPLKIHVSCGYNDSLDQNNWWFVKMLLANGSLTMLAYYDGNRSCLTGYQGIPTRIPFRRDTIVHTNTQFLLVPLFGGYTLGFLYRD